MSTQCYRSMERHGPRWKRSARNGSRGSSRYLASRRPAGSELRSADGRAVSDCRFLRNPCHARTTCPVFHSASSEIQCFRSSRDGRKDRTAATGAAMTRDKAIYWSATGIVCAVMVFSAINFNLENPIGPMKGAFAHLGFPDYFRIELTVAKTLGVLALLMPGIPSKAREFAYAGFAITLISASIAHASSGDPLLFVVDPLFFLGALV